MTDLEAEVEMATNDLIKAYQKYVMTLSLGYYRDKLLFYVYV